MATLDLHAVLTEKIAKNTDAIVIYRTYPHIDMAERDIHGLNKEEQLQQDTINKARTTVINKAAEVEHRGYENKVP